MFQSIIESFLKARSITKTFLLQVLLHPFIVTHLPPKVPLQHDIFSEHSLRESLINGTLFDKVNFRSKSLVLFLISQSSLWDFHRIYFLNKTTNFDRNERFNYSKVHFAWKFLTKIFNLSRVYRINGMRKIPHMTQHRESVGDFVSWISMNLPLIFVDEHSAQRDTDWLSHDVLMLEFRNFHITNLSFREIIALIF